MKHVGLNVAADAFINSAITGVNGGMVLVVADDPSMHSSQNEQDSRFYGKFAMIPVFEPSNQQEAYTQTYEAFEYSEKRKVPVMIRITTRLSHSRSGIQRTKPIKQNDKSLPGENNFILLPAIARKQYDNLLKLQETLENDSEDSKYNTNNISEKNNKGIIACGIAYNYLMENRQLIENTSILKISHYPVPLKTITKLMNLCDEVLILEEGMPLLEEQLKDITGKCNKIKGRLSGELPRAGELNPDIIREAIIGEKFSKNIMPEIVKNRPPELCKGCSHRDLYDVLNDLSNEYKEWRVFSDIGCYTLGALPPFSAIHTCVDMGASVTMAKGASDAGLKPALCVIGDSTFTHSGITGLLDAVNDNNSITVIISDNSTTAMTGGQKSAGTGRMKEICSGIGVKPEHIITIDPLKKNFEKNKKAIKKELDYDGVSVVIAQRECIQTLKKKKK
jgi:indolepyruvate ferredoxin oxidoreductase alpha subunit